MNFIGIDPGSKGGVAIIYEAHVSVNQMPMIQIKEKGKKVKNIVDVRKIYDLFIGEADCVVAVEAQWSRPSDGKAGLSTQFANYGRILGACEVAEVEKIEVAPIKWQNYIFKKYGEKKHKDTKKQSIEIAEKLYPSVSLLPSKKSKNKSDGMADALLIATWLKETYENS